MSNQLTRSIPSTGEKIPALGLGTYNVFDVGSLSQERDPLKQVLKGFIAAGGKAVDSSPMYGNAEVVTGDLSTELGIGKRLFFATKVWTTGRQAGIRQMEDSFRFFKTEVIDLMQVHNLVDWETHLETLRSWKEQGRIRYTGITHYTTSAFGSMARIMKSHRPDFIQIYYSIMTREAEKHLLPLAAELGIGVIANRPLETSGLFSRVKGKALPAWAAEIECSTWAQFFLKFVLSHPAITIAIPATSQPDHLEDNMRAGMGVMPDKKMREKMAQFVEKL